MSFATAKEHGYSDEEILDYFSKKDPNNAEKIKQAQQYGYSPEEIIQHLSPKKEKKGFPRLPESQRLIGQHIARAAETALGAPRAVGEFLESIVPEKLLTKGAEKIGLGKPAKALLETTKKYAPYKLFPKKEQVRELGKSLFGETFEPKNEWEKKSNELIEDFVDLTLGSAIGGAPKLLKPFVTALGGNLAKEGITQLGGKESHGELAKLGTFALSAFINPKAAEKFYTKQYKLAREARPDDAIVRSPLFRTKLNNLETELEKGGSETWKNKIFTKIRELHSKTYGEEVDVAELEAFKRSINNMIGELYQEKQVPKTGIKSAQRYANKLGKIVDDSLKEYGKVNPEWFAHYQPANEAFGATAQSKKFMNSMKRNIGKLGLSHAGVSILSSYLFGPTGAAGTAAVAGTGYMGVKSIERIVQSFKSPSLRKHFISLYQSSLRDDIPAMAEAAKKLEKELEKENQ